MLSNEKTSQEAAPTWIMSFCSVNTMPLTNPLPISNQYVELKNLFEKYVNVLNKSQLNNKS